MSSSLLDLHDDALSVIASNSSQAVLKTLRATSKRTKAAADVYYTKLNNTLLTILFDTNTDTCLKTLCSHLKQALNRLRCEHVSLETENVHVRDNFVRLYDTVAQACKVADKEVDQARQKRLDAISGDSWNTLEDLEALTDDIETELWPLQAKSKHFHQQLSNIAYYLEHPQDLNLNFITSTIVGHLLRDSDKFARNVVTLYNAYVVGSNSICETSTFKFVETSSKSKTRVVINPTGKVDQSESTKVETIYTFFQSDGVYNLSVKFVDNYFKVLHALSSNIAVDNNNIITIEIPMNAAKNALFVQEFIDSIKELQTFSAVPDRGWYRTGPAFLSYIDKLLWSCNINTDNITLKWESCGEDTPPHQTRKTAAKDIVNRITQSNFPFNWNKDLECVDFRASFVDLCHVTPL